MVQEIEKCPVTGLPIARKTWWTDIRISEDFVVTYQVIGDRILHAIPRGHFGKADSKKLRSFLDRVLKEAAAPGVKIVEIHDLKNISGSLTKFGIMNVIRYFEQKAGQHSGIIVFNVSRKTKLFLRTAWRILKETYPFEIVDDYESAVKRAIRLIQHFDIRTFFDPGNFITRQEWKYQGDTLYTEFQVFGDSVLYAIHKGYLQKHDVEPVGQIVAKIFDAGYFKYSPPYQIADYSGVTGASWYGRANFLKGFKWLKDTYGPPKAVIIIGGSRIINIAMKMAQKKMGITMAFAKNIDEALSIIRQLEESLHQVPSSHSAKKPKKEPKNLFEKYEDEILDFVGSFTWDTPGRQVKDIENNHPLKSVFDAISLIKIDIDELLLESKKAREEAEYANNAKSQFLATISHEIRTPLNGILGMTDLLLRSQLTENQRDQLMDIKYSGESLMDIINEILDFSKIESGKVELDHTVFEFSDMIHRLLRILAVKAHEKRLELLCAIDPGIPGILMGDPVRLRQVLLNLVDNAVKFTDEGEVLLGIIKKNETDRMVTLKCSISDTGVGIPKEKLSDIFEKFSQVDNSTTRQYSGTGLGLAIVRSLVELMGGNIDAESTVGKGSRFFFEISLEKAHEKQAGPREEPGPDRKHLRALVADHNETGRKILADILTQWNIQTEMAADGAGVIKKVKESSAKKRLFDIIFLDCKMLEENGPDIQDKIAALTPGAKPRVLLLSYANIKTSTEELKRTGVDEILVKPVTRYELKQVLDRLTGEKPVPVRSPLSEPVNENTLTKLSVLLVEDNLINRKFLERLLKLKGWEVIHAKNGLEAIRQYSENTVDVILMDIQMPEMDGYEAALKIREMETSTGRHVPIIALTAHALKSYLNKSYSSGMDDYLTKPIDAEKMYRAIHRLTGHSQ